MHSLFNFKSDIPKEVLYPSQGYFVAFELEDVGYPPQLEQHLASHGRIRPKLPERYVGFCGEHPILPTPNENVMHYQIIPLIQGPPPSDPEDFIDSSMSYPISPAPKINPTRRPFRLEGRGLPKRFGDCYLATYMTLDVAIPVETRTCRRYASRLSIDDLGDINYDLVGDIAKRKRLMRQKEQQTNPVGSDENPDTPETPMDISPEKDHNDVVEEGCVADVPVTEQSLLEENVEKLDRVSGAVKDRSFSSTQNSLDGSVAMASGENLVTSTADQDEDHRETTAKHDLPYLPSLFARPLDPSKQLPLVSISFDLDKVQRVKSPQQFLEEVERRTSSSSSDSNSSSSSSENVEAVVSASPKPPIAPKPHVEMLRHSISKLIRRERYPKTPSNQTKLIHHHSLHRESPVSLQLDESPMTQSILSWREGVATPVPLVPPV